jgi:hypothetical protein
MTAMIGVGIPRSMVHGLWSLLLLSSVLCPPSSGLAQAPQLINYQGRLLDGTNLANGTVGLTLQLYDAAAAGTLLYADSNHVTVIDGLYATYLGDGTVSGALDAALTNAQVWLEAVVDGTVLTPRERLVAVPYARAVPGLRVERTNNIVLNPGPGGNVIQPGTEHATIGGGAGHTIGPAALHATIGGGLNHSIGGTAEHATIAGGLANRVESNATGGTVSGGGFNWVYSNASYAVIAGGSAHGIGPRASHSAVGGGNQNSIGADATHAVIAGGRNNAIHPAAGYSLIGGGFLNSISNFAEYSTIGGGFRNVARSSALYGAIAGGQGNQLGVNSLYATVPGGRDNLAGSSYTFAAGRRAQALHPGSFVWGDSTDADIASTGDNQFLVRAGGGLGVNVTNIGAGLAADLGGRLRVRGSTAGVWLYDQALAADRGFVGMGDGNHVGFYGHVGAGWGFLMSVSNGYIGIGKFDPAHPIDVASGAYLSAGGVWTSVSDVHRKRDFQPVDAQEILDKVAALPITTWSYLAEPGVRHIGPTAQDFHAAFGVGPDEKAIAQIDPDGVALAAIQALAQESGRQKTADRERQAQIDALRNENAELKAKTEELEARLRALEAR